MFNFCRLGVQALVTVALIIGVMGCGSVSNNDQGASFLSLGYFTDGDGETGDLGRVVLVNRDVPSADDYEWIADPFMGLENRLSTQYIRVTRIDCEYEIPGADPSLSIPAGVFNMSTVINGIGDDDDEGDGGAGDAKNPVYSQFIMVSPDLFSFLSVNQNLLPELPYHMTAICRATGISEAGDVLTTNDSPYQIIFSDQRTDGDTTTGFETGPGTGGDPSVGPISETSSLVANSASEMDALEDEYL